MKIKLTHREKRLMFLMLLFIVFYYYWQVFLGPLINSIIATQITSANLQISIANLQTAAAKSAAAAKIAEKDAIKIYPRDEQISYVMRFIDYKFRWFGIQLLSMSNTPGESNIVINLKFKSTPHQLSGFLNSFPQAKTALVIDSASIAQQDDKLISDMRILTYFLKH